MNAEWFADRLKELREVAGLSQQELANKAGMTREGVAQLEIRRRKPSWESVVALCQALGIGCDAFMKEPANRTPAGPGRPRKTPADQVEEPSASAKGEAVEGVPGVASGATRHGKPAKGPATAKASAKSKGGAGKGSRGKRGGK